MAWLRSRGRDREWMDDPAQSETAFRAGLRDLEFLNRITLGYGPTIRWLDRLAQQRGLTTLSVLDVGAGGGDMLRRIAAWGRTCGITVACTGLDRSQAAQRHAAEAGTPGAWITGDLFGLPDHARFDVVVCSLLAHHLTDAEIVRLLRWMDRCSTMGWLVSDIHRHSIAWLGLWVGVRLLRLDPMVVHDSTASVARAFRGQELRSLAQQAGVGARVAWHMPFRWTLSALHPP